MCHRLVRTKAGMLIKDQDILASLEKAVKLAKEQYLVAVAEMASAKQIKDKESTYYGLQKDLKNHGAPYW